MADSESTPIADDGRPTVVIYGNCQADAATTIFSRVPGFNERYRAVFFPSYNHPTCKVEDIPQSDLDACVVLLEQHDQVGFAQRGLMRADLPTVKFPALDFNLFWPFNCINPFNTPDAANPLGPFPYGDRIIVNCVRQGMSAAETYDFYLNNWEDYKVDLHRLAALETARIAQRDSRSNIKLGTSILEQFHDRRLFWTVNHPCAELLAELTTGLLTTAFANDTWVGELDMLATIKGNFGKRGPLGSVGVPIHPRVAKYLGLKWYSADDLYRAGDGRMVTHEEYLREMIAHSVALQAVQPAVNAS